MVFMVSIGIVVSDYRSELTGKMLEFAQVKARKLGAKVVAVSHAPGALETPLVAKRLLEKKGIAGVVVIAVVLQGGTWHDIMVAENAYRKLLDLSLEFNKPVCSAIIGPRVSKQKALKRLQQYSEHAVEATVKMIK